MTSQSLVHCLHQERDIQNDYVPCSSYKRAHVIPFRFTSNFACREIESSGDNCGSPVIRNHLTELKFQYILSVSVQFYLRLVSAIEGRTLVMNIECRRHPSTYHCLQFIEVVSIYFFRFTYFNSFLPKTDTCIFGEAKWEPLEKKKLQ